MSQYTAKILQINVLGRMMYLEASCKVMTSGGYIEYIVNDWNFADGEFKFRPTCIINNTYLLIDGDLYNSAMEKVLAAQCITAYTNAKRIPVEQDVFSPEIMLPAMTRPDENDAKITNFFSYINFITCASNEIYLPIYTADCIVACMPGGAVELYDINLNKIDTLLSERVIRLENFIFVYNKSPVLLEGQTFYVHIKDLIIHPCFILPLVSICKNEEQRRFPYKSKYRQH